jgi:hypothetical protein
MECTICNKELTRYEEHGFWNKNPYSKLCIDCMLEITPPDEKSFLKKQIEKSKTIWERRTRKYKDRKNYEKKILIINH